MAVNTIQRWGLQERPKIAVAIPAYNEEKTIPYVIRSLRENLGDNCRIVVVDDGSTDRTGEMASNSGADMVVRHARNRGVAMTYRCAVQLAAQLDPEVICTIDADMQYSPADVRKLVKPILDGKADVVLGSRFLNREGYNGVPIVNFLSNRLMGFFVSLLAGKKLHDVESGFRAISGEAAQEMTLLGWVSFSHDMILDASWRKLRIVEMPVSAKYFKNRQSRAIDRVASYGLRAVLAMLVKMISFHFRPRIARRRFARSYITHVSDAVKEALIDLGEKAELLGLSNLSMSQS